MNKNEAKIISGIAIFLMVLLHVLAGGLFTEKSVIFSNEMVGEVAYFGKICVSIFAFISGYGQWVNYQKEYVNFSTLIKENFIRLFRFFICYYWPWVVVGALLTFHFEHKFSIYEFLGNLSGINFSYNHTWWYVRYYIFMLLILYPFSVFLYKNILQKLEEKNRQILVLLFYLLSVAICLILLKNKTGSLCIFSFISGEICAANDYIAKLRNNKKIVILFFIVGIFIRLSYTNERGALLLDFICIPFMIPMVLDIFEKLPRLGCLLNFFGIHSTTMWLMHIFIWKYSTWLTDKMVDGVIGFAVIFVVALFVSVLYEKILTYLKKE